MRVIIFPKRMKRVLQVVAVVVIAVLAAQPALAGMTCGMLTVANVNCGHGASLCGMAMSQMGWTARCRSMLPAPAACRNAASMVFRKGLSKLLRE